MGFNDPAFRVQASACYPAFTLGARQLFNDSMARWLNHPIPTLFPFRRSEFNLQVDGCSSTSIVLKLLRSASASLWPGQLSWRRASSFHEDGPPSLNHQCQRCTVRLAGLIGSAED